MMIAADLPKQADVVLVTVHQSHPVSRGHHMLQTGFIQVSFLYGWAD